jgi:hypothetical protein
MLSCSLSYGVYKTTMAKTSWLFVAFSDGGTVPGMRGIYLLLVNMPMTSEVF